MIGIVLFEDEGYANLLPLVYWRSVFELHLGRKILLDRIAQRLGLPVTGVWTRSWIAAVAGQRCGAPANGPIEKGTVLVNGRWLCEEGADFPAAPCVGMLGDEVAYVVCDAKLAENLAPNDLLDPRWRQNALDGVNRVEAKGCLLHYPWDVVGPLANLLASDWRSTDASIESDLDSRLDLGPTDRIHVGQCTKIHPTAVIDATEGPIYISHDVRIGAYVVLEGPAYVGPGTRISPHAYLHGGNGIGPMCKLGGEIDGCVFHGYTNKPHEGYLGHSYVGSWVNIGAGATNSDLKNTYSDVRVPLRRKEINTEQQFFGSIIGDHAKLGINAALPTGVVVGFSAMVAGTRVAPKFVPSFAWLTDDGLSVGKPDRLLDVATRMMVRRGVDMTDDEVELFLELGERARTLEVKSR